MPRFEMSPENTTIDQAAYDTVHGAIGGAKVVAAQMAMSHQVLVNKVGLNNTTHYLTLQEAVTLMRVTGNLRLLNALAETFDGMFVPVPRAAAEGAPNLMGDLARMSAEFGELMREVADDLADGVITDNEMKRVEREADGLRTALSMLLKDLRVLNESSRRRGSPCSRSPRNARTSMTVQGRLAPSGFGGNGQHIGKSAAADANTFARAVDWRTPQYHCDEGTNSGRSSCGISAAASRALRDRVCRRLAGLTPTHVAVFVSDKPGRQLFAKPQADSHLGRPLLEGVFLSCSPTRPVVGADRAPIRMVASRSRPSTPRPMRKAT